MFEVLGHRRHTEPAPGHFNNGDPEPGSDDGSGGGGNGGGIGFKRFQDKAMAGITTICLALVAFVYLGDHNKLEKHLDAMPEKVKAYDTAIADVKQSQALDHQMILEQREALKEINGKLDTLIMQRQVGKR